MARTRAKCPVCQRGPYQLGNLYDHLRFVHWWAKDKVDELKLKIKNMKFEGRQFLKCECGKVYYSQHGLRVHREKMHGVPVCRSATYYPVTCPACHHLFRTGEELAVHCNEMHREQGGQDFTMIQGSFPTQEEFEAWIDSVERLTRVDFTKRTSRLCKDGRNHIFVCKHARGKGAVVDPKELKQRFKKSDRVHSHCPAFIRVIENMDGSVSYRGCLGHLGHKVGIAKPIRTPRQKFRRWQTHRRHKDAVLYYTPRVDAMISELSDNTWAVQAEDGYEYTVAVGDPCDCGESNIHCDRCGACPQQIRCNCTDVAHQGVACIHAHAVATFMDKARQRIPSVKHYLATEMPGCASAPGPSEHDEDAPSPLDDSEDASYADSHYEEYQLREEEQLEGQSSVITPPSSSRELRSSASAQKSRPYVVVEPLRRTSVDLQPLNRVPVKAESLSLSPPVITLREEAKEELEHFQGLDEKLHMMLQTCMQSNLPHVIRDIRAAIESKLTEILTVNGEKTPKNRLQKTLRLMKLNEAEPSSSGNHQHVDESLLEQPSSSHENKTPVTRKVLRREFLEARSSRIPLRDETRKDVLGTGPQHEQNQQMQGTPQSTRKILKREFIEASTSRCRLLAERLQPQQQAQQKPGNETDIQKHLSPTPANVSNQIPAKVLRRDSVEATQSQGMLSKKQSQLGPLPPGCRRVVKQTITTQGGRRVVKRVVVLRRPMPSSEISKLGKLQQTTAKVGKTDNTGEDMVPKDVAEVEEVEKIVEQKEENLQSKEASLVSPESIPGSTEIPVVTLEDSEPPRSAEEQPAPAPKLPLYEKIEGPVPQKKTKIKDPGQSAASVERGVTNNLQSAKATPELQKTESQTTKEGARVIKKIYARRGSEWVLKRVVIRTADEHGAAKDEKKTDGQEVDTTPKATVIGGEGDPAKNKPRRIIKRMVIRRSATAAPLNDKCQKTVAPSQTDDRKDTPIHRTSTLIQKSLSSALSPKSAKLPVPTETLCVMCGKTDPPEHSPKDTVFWLGCSNAKRCHVRAHEKCLRAARARCFICHAGTWVRVIVKDSVMRTMRSASAEPNAATNGKPSSDAEAVTDVIDTGKDDKDTEKEKTPETLAEKPVEERSPALCEVNS